jgi:hypothetical protein
MIDCFLDELLLLAGIGVNTALFLSMFFYSRKGANFRMGCSFIAYVMMCMSILTIIRILSGFADGVMTYDFYELFWQGIMCLLLIENGGNVSFFIGDRKRRRPQGGSDDK